MSQTDVEAFVSTTLAYLEPSCETPASNPIPLNPVLEASSSESRVDCLSQEIVNIIITDLALSDVLGLCCTSGRLLCIMDSTFWRLQTHKTHTCWFLKPKKPKNRPVFSPCRIGSIYHGSSQQVAPEYSKAQRRTGSLPFPMRKMK